MKAHALLCALALTLGAGVPMAQAASPASVNAKPVVNTTCKDYLAMDETAKPNFIHAASQAAHKDNAKKVTSIIVDKLGVEERLKPELEQYCQRNLDKSAYEHAMKASVASEKSSP